MRRMIAECLKKFSLPRCPELPAAGYGKGYSAGCGVVVGAQHDSFARQSLRRAVCRRGKIERKPCVACPGRFQSHSLFCASPILDNTRTGFASCNLLSMPSTHFASGASFRDNVAPSCMTIAGLTLPRGLRQGLRARRHRRLQHFVDVSLLHLQFAPVTMPMTPVALPVNTMRASSAISHSTFRSRFP